MDNAAFEDEPASEAARILRAVADSVELRTPEEPTTAASGKCFDLNGNSVGEWRVSE